ncbi:cache domain-containing protein, partial [Chamaesiphon sp.]|uniref:cache domain-containing protein n=1 Tax=Chamaesiphon sp. TaxID=2814140 RepID=UPI0035932BD7
MNQPDSAPEQLDKNSDLATPISPSITPAATWWQQPAKIWNNLSIRAKITTLLITGAVIPVVAVTQGLVGLARDVAIKDLRASLETKLLVLGKSVKSETRQIEDNSHVLAQSVVAAGIDLDNAGAIAAQQAKLTGFIQTAKDLKPNASFYLITNSKGQTVAQSIQTVRDDFTKYAPLPTDKTTTQFSPVPSKSGIELGEIDIVKAALTKSRSLSGVELVKSQSLQQLGLAQQANIGMRQQSTQGLSELKKPYPEGTFNVEGGKVGLVVMSVQPIRVNGKQVGSAIVGTMLNRNFELVDRLKSEIDVPIATLIAQDWRVSTNVPYTDEATRAIGTRVSKSTADRVLKEGKVYLGDANIIGIDYLTGYAPLYDHRQQLDPATAKPIGISSVGKPQTQVDIDLQQLTLTGYAVGGGILVLVIGILVLAPSDRSISRPIKGLTLFADRIAAGQSGVRLVDNDRRDEVGILTRNLNQMAQNVDANLEARQQEAELQRQQREELENGIFNLVTEIEGATDGDLRVRASLDSLELSTVADLFNA